MLVIDYTNRIKHWNKRARAISYIVLHNTTSSIESTLSWFENPVSKVSAHFVIDRLGVTYKCVNEDKAAWAVGSSRGNHTSISIEIVATEHESGMTEIQEKAVIELLKDLMKKYDIPAYGLMLHRWMKPGGTSCPILIWEHDDDFIHWRQRWIN